MTVTIRNSAADKVGEGTNSRTAEAYTPRLRIRMYRHGLGDCLLLRFGRPNGESFNFLIDCGLIGVAREPKQTMIDVANDIKAACNGRLDVVAMTHEHWDHASGFSEQQARSVFEGIEIVEVWYAWTEDPQNELGRRLRKERAAKVAALATAATALTSQAAVNASAAGRAIGLANMLRFFGLDGTALSAGTAPIGKTRDAFEYLANRRGVQTRYCHPQKPPRSLGDVENVRVFVLGPPQDEGLLKKSSPTKSGRETYEFAAEASLAKTLDNAFGRLGGAAPLRTDDCPFDNSHRIDPQGYKKSANLSSLKEKTWDAFGEQWRQAELDWTQVAETLALNLDSHTNNTSLVLAFEFTDTGEVFLFPADAQIGNWLSWQDLRWKCKDRGGNVDASGPDLLSRTVFYKVGHHGSHNASLRKLGLEMMSSEDFVAFIPVSISQAQANRWMSMPFEPLVKRLKEKTGGRLLQTDGKPPTDVDLAGLEIGPRQDFTSALTVHPGGLYFELSFPLRGQPKNGDGL